MSFSICSARVRPTSAAARQGLVALTTGIAEEAVAEERLLALDDAMTALAIHPDLTYEHRWKAGELIVWDNRCVMHRAKPYDPATQGRVIRRCTVLGEVPA